MLFSFDSKTERTGYIVAGLLLILVSGVAKAQRGRQAGGGGDNFEMQAMQAAQKIEHIAQTIMTDHVGRAIPLTAQDIQSIGAIMDDLSKYRGRMDKPRKATTHLVEAYLAYYSGKGEEAIDLVRKAIQQDPENLDVSDTAIVLALCHENYMLAKSTLKQRNAGEDVTLAPLSELDQTESAMSGFGGAAPDQFPPAMGSGSDRSVAPGQPDKWTMGAGQAGGRMAPMGGGFDRGMMGADRPMVPGGGMGMASNRRAGGAGTNKGTLGLPIECMPYDDLGKDFASLNLKNIDGSYFYYEAGKRQMLCLLLWALPYQDVTQQGGPGGGGRGYDRGLVAAPRGGAGRSRSFRSGGMGGQSNDSPFSQVAFDLEGNLDQYRNLMLYNSRHGRIMFLTLNMDAANQYNHYRILTKFIEEPWPWINCMAYDQINESQLHLAHRYSPVMVIVDSKSKIRYIGPVGGFLPQMLIGIELPNAAPGMQMEAPKPPAGPTAQGGGLLGWLTGKDNPDETGAGTDMTVNSTAGDSQAATKESTGTSQYSSEKESDPQAKSMLKLVYVKKKINPRSAMIQCDEIISRYPDSLEADEAKLIIEGILKTHSDWTQERKQKGLYTGE